MEHGSAKWGNVSEICRRYCEKQYTNNLLLTQHFRMGLDGYKHKRNLNVLVVGGSGAGKSRTYAIPNIMQCNCSMVITDPKAELLRKTGGVLERNGYEVRVFDLINPETSWCYNPFAYVRDDKDVLKLINNLIRNTTPKGAQSSDPFWEKSETALLQALMLYLLHEAPPEEQNFPMIMEMLGSAQVKEDDEMAEYHVVMTEVHKKTHQETLTDWRVILKKDLLSGEWMITSYGEGEVIPLPREWM